MNPHKFIGIAQAVAANEDRRKGTIHKDRFIPNSTAMSRFMTKFNVNEDGCWIWTGSRMGRGRLYGSFALSGKSKVGAHIASFALFNGDVDKSLDVAHTCGNHACVNPKHLIQCTHKENQQELIESGRNTTLGKKGSQNHYAKLSEDDVRKIRILSDIFSNTDLGMYFMVDRKNINFIKRGDTWKHVEMESI